MNNKYEEIVQALHARLSELTGHVAEIDSELRKPLSARNEEQATDLENQDALEGIEKSKLQEIQRSNWRSSGSPKAPTAPAPNAARSFLPNVSRRYPRRRDAFHARLELTIALRRSSDPGRQTCILRC